MPELFDDRSVLYPVPIQFVSDVTRLLNDLTRQTQQSVPAEVPTETPTDNPWSTDEFRKLMPLISKNRIASTVLKLTAKKPGQLVSFPEACNEAGVITAQGRAGMGALRKVCKKIGKERWPIIFQWAAGGENVAYYYMTPENAKCWNEVVDE